MFMLDTKKVVQLYSEASMFALHYLVKVSLLQIVSRLVSSFFKNKSVNVLWKLLGLFLPKA